MDTEQVETLVIGGGQAGLVMSHMLSRRGRPHLVLERGRLAERWRSERWDGLRFQFPNWSVRLPGLEFAYSDPDGFATSADIVAYLEDYARRVDPPLRCGCAVERLGRSEDGQGFCAITASGRIVARNVVLATGPYQRPVVPDLLADDCALPTLHANHYKAPDQLPAGAVLVVGSGASGAQIAEELARAGRRVYLCVGRHKRMPRRYRGHDLIWWLEAMGLHHTPVAQRGPDTSLPLITGAYGGHTIDFRSFAEQGITLLGHLRHGGQRLFEFAGDLAATLAYGDAAHDAFLDLVDAFVAQKGWSLPAEPAARVRPPTPAAMRDPPRRLYIDEAGIGSVLWATGYALDYGWIDLPVFDARGVPEHDLGVARQPGLYFLGLPWLSRLNSSFLSGVADDAERLAEHICQGSATAAWRGTPDSPA